MRARSRRSRLNAQPNNEAPTPPCAGQCEYRRRQRHWRDRQEAEAARDRGDADREGPRLYQAIRDLAATAADEVLGFPPATLQPEHLKSSLQNEKFGRVSFLMNNAGLGNNPGQAGKRSGRLAFPLIDVNSGVVVRRACGLRARHDLRRAAGHHRCQHWLQQGITTPPVTSPTTFKASPKAYTRPGMNPRNQRARNSRIVHPQATYTGLNGPARRKPAGAWTPTRSPTLRSPA